MSTKYFHQFERDQIKAIAAAGFAECYRLKTIPAPALQRYCGAIAIWLNGYSPSPHREKANV